MSTKAVEVPPTPYTRPAYAGRVYEDNDGWVLGFGPPPGWTTRGWARARRRAFLVLEERGGPGAPLLGRMLVKTRPAGWRWHSTYTG